MNEREERDNKELKLAQVRAGRNMFKYWIKLAALVSRLFFLLYLNIYTEIHLKYYK